MPRLDRLLVARELLMGDVVANGELLGVHLRLPERERRHELFLRERFVHFRLHLRFVVFRRNAGRDGLLLQVVVLRLDAEVLQRGFRGLDLEVRVLQLLIELRVEELEDHAVGGDRRSRVEQDAFDAPLRGGGNPADVLRHQRAGAAHFAEQRAALDGIDPERGALDAGSGRLEPREAERDEEHRQRARSPRKRSGGCVSGGRSTGVQYPYG